jgi:hypothetical protein
VAHGTYITPFATNVVITGGNWQLRKVLLYKVNVSPHYREDFMRRNQEGLDHVKAFFLSIYK